MAAPQPTPDAEPLHGPVLAWYDAHQRDLPWRDADCSPWGVLVSEVMLQQTPVARVLPVWREWMQRWPRPADLAAEPSGEAIRAWGRLGYPRRAIRLHAAATAITTEHDGEVPDTEEALRSLPGVGDYTAAAVAAFAFGRRAVVIDTNVRRVLGRALDGQALPRPSMTKADRDLAGSALPDDAARSARWNVAAMELGALVCTARTPRCGDCPIAAHCAWAAAGYPPYDGPPRRGQAWKGTDRQCRGVLIQALREATAPLTHSDLRLAYPDDEAKRLRCLDELVAEGLVATVDTDLPATDADTGPTATGFTLPGH